MKRRSRYGELYNNTYKKNKRHEYLADQLRRVILHPDALHASLLRHVRVLLTTQEIGKPLYHLVAAQLRLGERLLIIRMKSAARAIQRAYLHRLYKPPPPKNSSTSFVVRCALHDLNLILSPANNISC